MSTVIASCTPVSRPPVLPSSSGTPASRSWRPAATTFHTSLATKCRRPVAAIRALPEKQRPAFSIPPTALLYPVQPPDGKERWDIKEEEDYVKLWFQVPGLSEDDLEINAGEDILEIKRKAGSRTGARREESPADVHGVGSFHVRLLMTKEYDSNDVTAELKAGMLEITVGKSKKRNVKQVGFGPKSPPEPNKNPGPPLVRTGNVPLNTPAQEKKPGPVPPPLVRTGNIPPNTPAQEKAGPNKAQSDSASTATQKGT